jgi:uncharacterized spore protein YtfJ
MDAHSEVLETIEQAKEAMTVRRVFGDPTEERVTMIPAARVQGGAGGSGGEGARGRGLRSRQRVRCERAAGGRS